MPEKRPIWKHHEMTEFEFRSVEEFGCIKSVESKSHWEQGVFKDESFDCLEATNSLGKKINLPHNWSRAFTFVGGSCLRGLFELNWRGKDMLKTLEAIDKFEEKSKRERATFERLKKKFGE